MHRKKQIDLNQSSKISLFEPNVRTSLINFMAIAGDRSRSAPSAGKQQITVEEFKIWLMKFDSDKDGRISQQELRKAIRSRGGWFSTRKSGRGISEADLNQSGYVDEDEIDNLLDFAEKTMGFHFYD